MSSHEREREQEDVRSDIVPAPLYFSVTICDCIPGPVYIIRASVDALCRDGTSEISRDPRTKRLQTRRESLARPSKHTNNNL